jgi:hypothetical protein
MSRGRKIIAKLRNKYRLVLINDSSFAEVFSIRLTPFNVLMLISSTLVVFTMIVFLLIAYTPVRQLMPGYGKGNDAKAWLELNQKVEDLKRDLDNRKIKEDAINNILSEKEYLFDSAASKGNKK